MLLLPYLHQAAASPYRASGPAYVRRGVRQRSLAVDEVPTNIGSRLISLRAYAAAHMRVAANVCDGSLAGADIDAHFEQPEVAYIHLRFAKRGCFSCQVLRA